MTTPELIGLVIFGVGIFMVFSKKKPEPSPVIVDEPKLDDVVVQSATLSRMDAMASADKLVRYFESRQHQAGIAAMRQVIVAVYETPKVDEKGA